MTGGRVDVPPASVKWDPPRCVMHWKGAGTDLAGMFGKAVIFYMGDIIAL